MKVRAASALLLLAACLAGCGDADRQRHDTSVLGGTAGAAPETHPGLTDAQGRAIPPPPAPAQARARIVRSGEAALAAWITENHVVASAWTPATGWSTPEPLERIYGESSDVQLASNGQGQAMALWHHRVGNIHSLRFSRRDANGWSPPDVLAGALPRPAAAGAPPGQDAPQLQMDPQGNAIARWPSGFRANEMQVARYAPGEGWSRPLSEPLAAAPSASPPLPAPSSAR